MSLRDPRELCAQEPRFVRILTDRSIADLAQEDLGTEANRAIALELWVRAWLYGEQEPQMLRSARASARHQNRVGHSEAFARKFEAELMPLRKSDPGHALPEGYGLGAEEMKAWGSLTARLRTFLEADGLIALIPPGPPVAEQGVAVPFRFVAGEPGACSDVRGQRLEEWSAAVEALGEHGPLAGDQAIRIEAPISDDEGASLGLAIVTAWSRRSARELGLFSPLALLATGEMEADRVMSVRGTGGENRHDVHGGAKGALAERLGVSVFIAPDMQGFRLAGAHVIAPKSGTSWHEVLPAIAAVPVLGRDDARHLRRVQGEDGERARDHVPVEEHWARLRRLERLARHAPAGERERISQWCRREVGALGFLSFSPGMFNFETVERRHPPGCFFGRNEEIKQLDEFLGKKRGVMVVAAPVGFGKSALLTAWRRSLIAAKQFDVFYHHFDDSDPELSRNETLYFRLMEHLLLRAEKPANRTSAATRADLLRAWDLFSATSNRRPLAVIIDGLDEAREADAPLPLPAVLPEGTWIVGTCRSGDADEMPHPFADAWVQHCSRHRLPFTRYALPAMDARRLEAWLATLELELRAWLPPLPEVAAALWTRTQGMALFVRHLLDEFREAMTSGESYAEVLQRTPAKFGQYLLHQWSRLVEQAIDESGGRAHLAQRMASTLTAAKGPLHRDEMRDILEVPADHLDVALVPEARRWIEWKDPGAQSAWGPKLALNHPLVREAIRPVTDLSDYETRVLAFCRNQWLQRAATGCSPYVLRHFPEHLAEKRAWDELEEIVTDPVFLRRQAEVFPHEPALALSTIRRTLQAEVAAEQADEQPLALTALALTQAGLVRELWSTIYSENVDEADPLALAERMTRLPLQWDPAAATLWHLLAAWLHQHNGEANRRDYHLAAVEASSGRIPAEWGMLASALLAECFDDPANESLRRLACRLLSPAALADLVNRLAPRKLRGWRAASRLTAWIPAGSFAAKDANRALMLALVPLQGWQAALHRAFGGRPPTSAAWEKKEAWRQLVAETIKALAFSWRDNVEAIAWMKACCVQLSREIRLLEEEKVWNNDQVRLQAEERRKGHPDPLHREDGTGPRFVSMSGAFLRLHHVLGLIAAWRFRLQVQAGFASEQEFGIATSAIERRIAHCMESVKMRPTAISVHLAAAEAFATGIQRDPARAGWWRQQAIEHQVAAMECWRNFRQRDNAQTLEIVQHWLWLGQSILTLSRLEVWPAEEAEARRLQTLDDIRKFVTSPQNYREAIARLTADEKVKIQRPLEPAEEAQVLTIAVEILRDLPGVEEQVLARAILMVEAEHDRAYSVRRCLSRWTDVLRVERLVSSAGRWRASDRAGVWAQWFARRTRDDIRDQPAALARFAIRSIREGTARVRNFDTFHRIEWLTEVALANHNAESRLASCARRVDETAPNDTMIRYRMVLDFARIISSAGARDSSWMDEAMIEARRLCELPLPGSAEVERLTIFARACFRIHYPGWQDALNRALAVARTRETLTERIQALGEVAEAAAVCREYRRADEIFGEAERVIPRADADARGMKVKMMRPHLLAELMSSLAKALSQVTYEVWADHYAVNWANGAQNADWLAETRRHPSAHDTASRARAVAVAWQRLFVGPRSNKAVAPHGGTDQGLRHIVDPSVLMRTHRDIAVLEAHADRLAPEAGHLEDALDRIALMANGVDKDDVLHRVGAVLAEHATASVGTPDFLRYRRAFLRILPHAAEYYGATYLMLARLVRLHPESGPSISDLNRRRGQMHFERSQVIAASKPSATG